MQHLKIIISAKYLALVQYFINTKYIVTKGEEMLNTPTSIQPVQIWASNVYLGVKCFVNKCSLRLIPKRLIISVQPLYQSSHVFSCTNKIHFGHRISLFKNLTCIGSLMKSTATCFVKWNIMSLKLQVYKTNRTKRMFNK